MSNEEPIAYERMGVEVTIEDPADVYVSMRRIRRIEGIDLEKITSLVVNACLLQSMEGVTGAVNLTNLELSENKIPEICGLEEMTKLRVLDLSFNELSSAENLEPVVASLEVLRLQNNHIADVPDTIGRMMNVTELELGSNRLTELKNIPASEKLQHLWLGRNKFRDAGVEPPNELFLPNLKIISLQSNALKKVPTALLLRAHALEEVYLSENFIDTPPDEQCLQLKNLEILDLSYNKLTDLGVISQMTQLTELWLNNNKLADLSQIKALAALTNLKTLYLDKNPFVDNLGPGYRQFVLDLLPQLEQLDAIYLGKVVLK